MSGVYKKITLVGTSDETYERAIKNAIDRAEDSLEDLQWFEVDELRGGINKDGSLEYQAVIQAAFELKE